MSIYLKKRGIILSHLACDGAGKLLFVLMNGYDDCSGWELRIWDSIRNNQRRYTGKAVKSAQLSMSSVTKHSSSSEKGTILTLAKWVELDGSGGEENLTWFPPVELPGLEELERLIKTVINSTENILPLRRQEGYRGNSLFGTVMAMAGIPRRGLTPALLSTQSVIQESTSV
jgi:hypothetical protein